MNFKTLAHTPLADITDAFNTAFTGYFVPINFTIEGMQERITRARIDLSASVGVFSEDKLIAFMLMGVGELAGRKTAYNAGTGVVPEYRRRRLVQRMYDWGESHWRAADFVDLSLEVIVENIYAIKAYEGVGFNIERRLVAYKYTAAPTPLVEGHWLEVNRPLWSEYEALQSFEPSWDFGRAGVDAIQSDYRFFEWRNEGQLSAYAIIHKGGRIAQAGIQDQKKESWQAFLKQLQAGVSNLNWINIDTKAESLIAAMQANGWEPIIEQYEMFRVL